MEETNNAFSWYEITTDIIIPLLGVISTLVIGILIAVILKRKEEKAKIKQLLIDHYMEFLSVRINDIEISSISLRINILQEIKLNQNEFFNGNANWHLPIGIIKERINELKVRLKASKEKDRNWSIFTYRFTFLLGKKTYFKNALPLEKVITSELISNEKRIKSKNDVLSKIRTDLELMSELNTSNSDKINIALDTIERIVVQEYNNYQFSIFNPYSNKIADLINDY